MESEPEKAKEPNIPSADAPAPLAYEAPRDRAARQSPPSDVDATGLVVLGAFISTIVVAFPSALLLMNNINFGEPGPPQVNAKNVAFGCGFILVSGIAAIGSWRYRKKTSRPKNRNWFVLGLLIGVGLACLLEGVCFALSK